MIKVCIVKKSNGPYLKVEVKNEKLIAFSVTSQTNTFASHIFVYVGNVKETDSVCKRKTPHDSSITRRTQTRDTVSTWNEWSKTKYNYTSYSLRITERFLFCYCCCLQNWNCNITSFFDTINNSVNLIVSKTECYITQSK